MRRSRSATDWRLRRKTVSRTRSPDAVVQAGPSGAAGVAGLMALTRETGLAELRRRLNLSPATRVLAIVTEGPTQLRGG